MLHWKKRISAWAGHVYFQHGRVPWLNLLRALLSGPVPADVWRARIRTCARCPVRSETGWICRRTLADGRTVGCNCDLVMKAFAARPYQKGCWAYEVTDGQIGWPTYPFPTARARWLAVWRFLSPCTPSSPSSSKNSDAHS